MASRAGRRTATESASSFSRGEASFHNFPRAKRRKESIPTRRWTKPRATPASDVDGGRTAQVYGINWHAYASSRAHPCARLSLRERRFEAERAEYQRHRTGRATHHDDRAALVHSPREQHVACTD